VTVATLGIGVDVDVGNWVPLKNYNILGWEAGQTRKWITQKTIPKMSKTCMCEQIPTNDFGCGVQSVMVGK
jgi:hypothetical protein